MKFKTQVPERPDTPVADQLRRLEPGRTTALGNMLLAYGLLGARLNVVEHGCFPVASCEATPMPGVVLDDALELDRKFFVQRVIMPMLWHMGITEITITLSAYELRAHVDLFNYVRTGSATETRFASAQPAEAQFTPENPLGLPG